MKARRATSATTQSKPQQLQMIWPRGRGAGALTAAAPAGYRVRRFRPADTEPYIEMMRLAGFKVFNREFLAGMRHRVIPGGFFVAEKTSTGKVVASAVATHNSAKLHPDGGELGWVAAHPQHRGKGLGLAVCAAVVGHFLARGYRRIYLKTDDWRLPAIRTYLKVGFRPFLFAPDMEKCWRAVCRRLRMPFEPAPEKPRRALRVEAARVYNVGIVGFGFIGKVHAYGYRNLPLFYDPVPLRARITHVCTSRRETAEKGAALIGAAHAVTDFREITENPDIDIVHICTPNHLHRAELLSALAHDKHIYCDKPLVADLAEAGEIRRALRRYRGIAQMTFQNRFFPATIRAKQLVDEGFPGRILEFRACYLHSGSADPDAPLKWKLSGAAGGGVIADLGSHVFDLMRHLLGDFESVLAATSIAYARRPSADDPRVKVKVDAEDCAHVLVRMKSGAIGTIEATKIATGAEDELRFEIHGSRGALRFNGTDPNHLEAYDATAASGPAGGRRGWTRIDAGQRYPAPASGFPGPKFSIGWLRSHMACLAHFLGCVASGRPARPDLSDGIAVQRLIEAARISATRGTWTRAHRPDQD